MHHSWFVLIALTGWFFGQEAAAQWQPMDNPLMTPFAEDVSPENVHPEYPRPQLQRGEDSWQNLNGLWNYAIRPHLEETPEEWDGQILVPFPLESALSGVKKRIDDKHQLWYQREFELPPQWNNQRVLLHFGAVDWETNVFVNGEKIGRHQGGNNSFSFEITHALRAENPQALTIWVWDPTNLGFNPLGKQVNNPHGIWYTPVTGIWQTVWLEAVPETAVDSLKIVPAVDRSSIEVTVSAIGDRRGEPVSLRVLDQEQEVAQATGSAGKPITVGIPEPKLWSPQSPHLYDLEVTLVEDTVRSYFGMRKISIQKDADGYNRLALNGEIFFQYGPLDQGWWPDGLLTPPTDEALRYDIEKTLGWGFNMIRKHVKVEPARWYYHCDKMGVLVWQDMPNASPSTIAYHPDGSHTGEPPAQYGRQFELELKRMIDMLHNHPSIIMWVPFNEGWGQYDTVRIAEWVKEYDPTRLVNNASGWTDFGIGDVLDIHTYPGPGRPEKLEDRAFVQGEFGGLGLPVENHLWREQANWGYRTYESREELASHYEALMVHLMMTIPDGMAAAVYTQTTDVETEVNGIMTYDRKVVKFDDTWLKQLHQRLPEEEISFEVLSPISWETPQTWQYTTTEPASGWQEPDFGDESWQTGQGMFGNPDLTPNLRLGTLWTSLDIWLRRDFELDHIPENVYLKIRHDEDAEVYLNGKLIADLEQWVDDYILIKLNAEDKNVLKTGRNVLAVHCRHRGGGQAIDVGLVGTGG